MGKLPAKLSKLFEVKENPDYYLLKAKKPVNIVIDGDLQITTKNGINILTLGQVNIDAKSIDLNSRTAQQLKDLSAEDRELILDIIGRLKHAVIEEVNLLDYFATELGALKEQMKQEILEELKVK